MKCVIERLQAHLKGIGSFKDGLEATALVLGAMWVIGQFMTGVSQPTASVELTGDTTGTTTDAFALIGVHFRPTRGSWRVRNAELSVSAADDHLRRSDGGRENREPGDGCQGYLRRMRNGQFPEGDDYRVMCLAKLPVAPGCYRIQVRIQGRRALMWPLGWMSLFWTGSETRSQSIVCRTLPLAHGTIGERPEADDE